MAAGSFATIGGQQFVFGPTKSQPTKRPRIVVDTKLVDKNMARVAPVIRDRFAKLLGPFADEVVEAISERTPVDTGDLQSTNRRSDVRKTKTLVIVDVRSGGIKGPARGKIVNYAATIHQIGSPRGRGRFYVIEPAIELSEKKLPSVARKAFAAAASGF